MSVENKTTDFIIHENGKWSGLDSENQHCHDPQLADQLVTFFQDKKASSVVDLGAGLGLYTEALLKNGILAHCYDGNIDTEVLSKGRCEVLDLSEKINIAKHDWALCLEVGEHLPQKYEDIFFSNIITHTKTGIVLSWAVPGQGGDGHVNLQSNEYVKAKMSNFGYVNNIEAENILRESCSLYWLKNTIMVFELPAGDTELVGASTGDLY